MKKILKIISAICILILAWFIGTYFFVLQYPHIKINPKTNKWYKVKTENMKSSDSSEYYVFFKKGIENKVMICFSGGGLSLNEQTADIKYRLYTYKMNYPDSTFNKSMVLDGIAADREDNPIKDWTIIVFPYTTNVIKLSIFMNIYA